MLAMSIFALTLISIAICFFFIPGSGDKKIKISELEQQNRELRLRQAELLQEIRTLRYALVLDLPYPDLDHLQQAQDAIREEYPDIKFKDE